MGIINKIVDELVNSELSLLTPLLKTKVFASQIKNQTLLNWVNNEINGYEDNIPEYRIAPATLLGTYQSYGNLVRNQVIPTIGLEKKWLDIFNQVCFYDSISTLETQAKLKENANGCYTILRAEFLMVLEMHLTKMGNERFALMDARQVFSQNAYVHAITVVRSKLLDFMLEIDSEFGEIDINEFKAHNDKITTIMNNVFNSGIGNVTNIGDKNEVRLNINIKKGDINDLKNTLSKNGIEEKDISEILEIIQSEPLGENKKFNVGVTTWIQKMIGKALDGSWEISIGAAGSLLAEAITKYYGG